MQPAVNRPENQMDLMDQLLQDNNLSVRIGAHVARMASLPLVGAWKGYSFIYGLLPSRLQYLASSITHGAVAAGLLKAASYSSVRLCQYFPPGAIQMIKIAVNGAKCVADLENCAMESLKCGIPLYIKGPMAIVALATGTLAVVYFKEAAAPSL